MHSQLQRANERESVCVRERKADCREELRRSKSEIVDFVRRRAWAFGLGTNVNARIRTGPIGNFPFLFCLFFCLGLGTREDGRWKMDVGRDSLRVMVLCAVGVRGNEFQSLSFLSFLVAIGLLLNNKLFLSIYFIMNPETLDLTAASIFHINSISNYFITDNSNQEILLVNFRLTRFDEVC